MSDVDLSGMLSSVPPSALSPILWDQMKAFSESTVWYSLIGTVLQAMLVSSVIGMTIKYFTYFTKHDSPVLLAGIGIGTTIQIGELALTCAEDYRLIYCGQDHFDDAFRFIIIADMVRLLTAAIFNVFAGGYYTWRVWMMIGRKWYLIPPFAMGGMVQMVMAVLAVAHGCKIPEITTDTIKQLPDLLPGVMKFFKAWGAITLAVDGALCVLMTVMLFKTQESLFHNETRVFKKLIALIYETMLPPVVCLLILEAASGSKGSPLTDMRRIITCILPVLYYHSALNTLVGRQAIRDILDGKLAEGGINLVSTGSGKGSGGRVYAAYPPGIRSYGGGEGAEERGIEMQSPISSGERRKELGGTTVNVKVEQFTTVSRSDDYILSQAAPPTFSRGPEDDEKSEATSAHSVRIQHS
ncbi:hypothetical protein IAU59_003379 [Kwoniella sp. CBS 9459]